MEFSRQLTEVQGHYPESSQAEQEAVLIPWPRLSPRRNFDLGIAAGRGCLNSFYDTLDVDPKLGPLLPAEYHDCDFSAGKILLVAQVLVRGQQNLETGLFRGRQQIAIAESIPALLGSRTNRVTYKIRADRQRRCLIENDAHPRRRKRAACRDCVRQTR
jgi:hypothetical protein